ncbi:MAG TPA: SCO family protein [Bacteroidia bacterium]|nr:SCO family protein [Bacteroidia bacterium]
MKTSAFAFLFLICISCNNDPAGKTEISGQGGIERLAIYYPLDSDRAGNKVYHKIPSVDLVAHDGNSFDPASLQGNVIVSDFFFARCAGTCPLMAGQMTRIQAAFAGKKNLKLVSYSVDPENDTVEVLQAYAQRFNADTELWKFVTGEKKKIYELARKGFFLPVEPGTGDTEDFIHSDQLVLVDKQLHIRGYYNGTDSASVNDLIEDAQVLLNEK